MIRALWYPSLQGLIFICLSVVIILSCQLTTFLALKDILQFVAVAEAVNPLTDTQTAEQRTIIQQYGDWYTGR